MFRFVFSIPPDSRRFMAEMALSSARAKEATKRALERLATECAAKVRERVETQRFTLVGLSEGWVAYKRRHNLDPRELIATREYLDSIEAKGTAVTCDGRKRKWLEYGFKGRGGTLHWTPVMAEMKAKAERVFAEEVMKSLLRSGK